MTDRSVHRDAAGSPGNGAAVVVGTIVSVNVGEPRVVPWAGREVTTAIWKEPVEGRVAVAGVNLAGDGQADRRVHGGPDKAVYAYAVEDYEWWSTELGRPIGPGTFGENLTVRGLDLGTAVVGEVWAAGTARLAVTEPRLPCFKLGIRMGDAAFVHRFDDARRHGTYLRIVEEGDIGAGDAVTLLSRPDHGLTAASIAAVYESRDRAGLEQLVTTPGVPESWRDWAFGRLERGS
jgi:MOSC domain-containing protein YiiM